MEILGVEGISLAPLPTGQGTFECQHGILPIPAPATVELLKGMEIVRTDEPFELVTPTGAALLSSWKKISGPCNGEIKAVSNSFGQRTLNKRPNLLRATLMELAGDSAHYDSCVLLETDIDDSSPEIIGALFEKLMEQGAIDVSSSPVMMKKQRMGCRLSVLCAVSEKERLIEMIFRESSTFGIRESIVKRRVLDRRFIEKQTKYGNLKFKVGSFNGEDIVCSPEYEDCIRLSKENGVPLKNIYNEAAKTI
jgi:uncharacterized protein (TIGR00299 family) protein